MSQLIQLGTFIQGEVPEPLEYQFLDASGTAIDLTGFTATFHLRIGGVDADLDASVSDEDEGKVTHTWLDGELTRANNSGALRCEFTVTNGTNTYTSQRMAGFIYPAIREPA